MEEVVEGKDFSFPKEEEKILQFWNRIDAFQTQLKLSEGRPEYVFYDGPPFATGLPHYGHILAGTIKDVVTRFQSFNGFHVTRRFGWDTHGLPVEYEIDQKLGIKTRSDVVDGIGIENYNEECLSIVMRYREEWRSVVSRVGRWIDFDNDYKTLDASFMESVWWGFKELHKKGLVYRGFKVMPYSTGCNTPLSNFEAGLNFKDVSDPAVMVAFPLEKDDDGAAMVAWTTTPWTLPSNIALCVNADFTYVKVKSKANGTVYIVAESRLSQLPKPKKEKTETPSAIASNSTEPQGGKGSGKKGEKKSKNEPTKPPVDASGYEILSKCKGSDLVGKKYIPPFDYFLSYSKEAFRVVADGYVTDDAGTGIVHQAPAFGEDDYRIALAAGIIEKGADIPNPVNDSGMFTDVVTDFKGRYVKEADKDIIALLKAKGKLVNAGSIMHSYPFCWRSDTPLLYKAVPSWFVAVERIRDKLVENNQTTYWVPESVKEKRFHNWLENARDWAVSRSRFWGTPLPIWLSDDGEEMVVIGSVKELEKLSGFKATNLHRHKIDHVTIPSKRGPEYGVLKRVEDVFDCWFESGSMPFASIHYPFENQDLFEKNFPGDFVAEGLDQTRGWFYTLMVLSTAIFGKPAFKNLVCNGMVLAEDGKKMSKRLKNYPSVNEILTEFGADALRLYLVNSPVVRGEPLRFKKEGVFAVLKDVFLPWYNAYRFLVQNALRMQAGGLSTFVPLELRTVQRSTNVLDRWINSASQSLVKFVRQEMEAYRLYTVMPYLVKFIDNLTNIYVRFNRKRLKGRTGEEDSTLALSTLYHVLLTTCKAMAPFTPFFTEALYQNLRKVAASAEESIHFCSFPEVQGETDARIEQSIARMMTVIDLARNIRERHCKPLKNPLSEMVVVHPDKDFLDDITSKLGEYVQDELNIRSVVPCSDPLKYASLRAEPDFSVLGKRLGRAMGLVTKEVKGLGQQEILDFQTSGSITIAGHTLTSGDIKVVRDFKAPEGVSKEDIDAGGDGDVLVVLDLRPDDSLQEAGFAREIVNRIQKLRQKTGLAPTDAVEIYYETVGSEADNSTLNRVFASQASTIQDSVGSLILPKDRLPSYAVIVSSEHFSGVAGGIFKILIARPALSFTFDKLAELCLGNKEYAENISVALLSRDPTALKSLSSVKVLIDGQGEYDVVPGEHFFLSVGEHWSAQDGYKDARVRDTKTSVDRVAKSPQGFRTLNWLVSGVQVTTQDVLPEEDLPPDVLFSKPVNKSPLPTPMPRPDGIRTVVEGSLYELYSPNRVPTVEVIFFHGLQLFDYREAYWTTWLSRDNTVLWPKEWLGPGLENPRILSVSYDSSARRTENGGSMDLYQITENLMWDLTRDDNDCPKILVGHSLGGLIIKRLLLDINEQAGQLGTRDPQRAKLERFLRNCRGVLYYATPHGGADLVDITDRIPDFIPNEPIINLLKVLGTETARINNKFSAFRRTEMLSAMTFSVAESRETKFFGGSKKFVVEGSPRYDLDRNYTEDADHFDVPKPKSQSSAAFTFLRDLCEQTVPAATLQRALQTEEERAAEMMLLR